MTLPQLSPLPGNAAIRPPPRRPREVSGDVLSASVSLMAANAPPGNTAARRNGLRYEHRALEYLKSLWPMAFSCLPTIRYADASGVHFCVPDGVLRLPSHAVVFEVKLAHTSDAWWQLRRLYQPVVSKLCQRPTMVVEVVRSFDPSVNLDETHYLVDDIIDWCANYQNMFGVFLWKP